MTQREARPRAASADMAYDIQIVIRVHQGMSDRIKEYTEQLSTTAGVPVSLAAATRKLLGDALDAAMAEPKPKKR